MYEPELSDEATSRAIDEAMATGEWFAEDEDEDEDVEEDASIIPDVSTMDADQLSR